jgi:hypothetical protein
MNSRQKKTFELLFKVPIPPDSQAALAANITNSFQNKAVGLDIVWADIESLLAALGAEISEGAGSRLRVKLNWVRAVFHRPHPQKITDKGAVSSVRRFLENTGVKP